MGQSGVDSVLFHAEKESHGKLFWLINAQFDAESRQYFEAQRRGLPETGQPHWEEH